METRLVHPTTLDNSPPLFVLSLPTEYSLVRVIVQPLILVPCHIWISTPLLVIVLSVVLGGGSKEHHRWSSSIAEDCLFTDELKQ